MADQQEGGSLLPPSEQQADTVGFQRGGFRNSSYEADLNRLDVRLFSLENSSLSLCETLL